MEGLHYISDILDLAVLNRLFSHFSISLHMIATHLYEILAPSVPTRAPSGVVPPTYMAPVSVLK